MRRTATLSSAPANADGIIIAQMYRIWKQRINQPQKSFLESWFPFGGGSSRSSLNSNEIIDRHYLELLADPPGQLRSAVEKSGHRLGNIEFGIDLYLQAAWYTNLLCAIEDDWFRAFRRLRAPDLPLDLARSIANTLLAGSGGEQGLPATEVEIGESAMDALTSWFTVDMFPQDLTAYDFTYDIMRRNVSESVCACIQFIFDGISEIDTGKRDTIGRVAIALAHAFIMALERAPTQDELNRVRKIISAPTSDGAVATVFQRATAALASAPAPAEAVRQQAASPDATPSAHPPGDRRSDRESAAHV